MTNTQKGIRRKIASLIKSKLGLHQIVTGFEIISPISLKRGIKIYKNKLQCEI